MKRILMIVAVLFLTTMSVSAQVGIGTITPDASAVLDVRSTTKGFLLPRMTTNERNAIAAPANGLLVFQTDGPSGLWLFIFGIWLKLTLPFDMVNQFAGSASNTSGTTIEVSPDGTPVPMPDYPSLGPGIGVDITGTNFTVYTSGRYRLAYAVNIDGDFLVGSRLTLNGTPLIQTTFSPTIPSRRFAAETILVLQGSDVITLQLYGESLTLNLLPNSQGAALTIQRID